MKSLKLIFFSFFILILVSCQSKKDFEKELEIKKNFWQGRLSLVIYDDSDKVKDSANLNFVLSGNEISGKLILSSFFGIQVAKLDWNNSEAKLIKGKRIFSTENLQDLVNELFKEEIPISVLFSLLRGEKQQKEQKNEEIENWQILFNNNNNRNNQKIIQAEKLTKPKIKIRILLN